MNVLCQQAVTTPSQPCSYFKPLTVQKQRDLAHPHREMREAQGILIQRLWLSARLDENLWSRGQRLSVSREQQSVEKHNPLILFALVCFPLILVF